MFKKLSEKAWKNLWSKVNELSGDVHLAARNKDALALYSAVDDLAELTRVLRRHFAAECIERGEKVIANEAAQLVKLKPENS